MRAIKSRYQTTNMPRSFLTTPGLSSPKHMIVIKFNFLS